MEKIMFRQLTIVLIVAAMLTSSKLLAAPVAVRHTEGAVHGFLKLSSMNGEALAQGDVIQVSRGDRVTTHLIFRFKDGSVHDESVVFSERGTFQLLRYHLVQKGPTFQRPSEVLIDAGSGQVTIRYTEDGKEKVVSKKMALPNDLANGLIFTLLKNVRAGDAVISWSMLAATPKPRLVKLAITPQGEDALLIGDTKRTATHYVVKIKIGGVAGAVAPLVGKQPPDIHVWVMGGESPAFVKSEGPLFEDGPIWRIELTSPTWPNPAPEQSTKPQEK
jgi:hypothetical protein